MADLSPDALAIFKAAWECPIILGDNQGTRMRQVAAALRAAADQVYHHWDGAECVDHLIALANELEAQ